MAFTSLKKGSKGDKVRAIQYIVGVPADGIFGTKTADAVKAYQKKNGLTPDGIVGKNTINKIISNAPNLQFGTTGVYVYAVESLLSPMKRDGVYSFDEVAHVKGYQASCGLTQDGVVGEKTYKALFGLSDVVPTPTNNGTNSKQPVNYKQYDSRWGSVVYTRNNTYNRSQTIKSSGCGPTSMADIVATWWDKTVTPKEMCALSVANGYRTQNSGTSWGFFSFIAKRYKASKFVQTTSFATMQNCLATGGYVVVSFRKSKWTNGGYIKMAS